MNKLILEDALKCNSIEVKQTLRFYGIQTRPLYKVLEYSTNPYIPNVTGNEQGAIRFLNNIGILHKQKNTYTRLQHLTKEDVEKLVTAIELHRSTKSNKDPIVGPVFLLNGEQDDHFRDIREFSTLLNSCGRMNNSSLGVGVCTGDKKIKKKALQVLADYRKEIIDALKWFYGNRNNDKYVIEKKNYVIINAGNLIRDTIIGTLASIISKSNIYEEGTIIMSCAYTLEDDIKVSTRIAGYGESPLDLRDLVKEIIKKSGGLGGGHRLAAGAVIPQEKEEIFLKTAHEVFGAVSSEKVIIKDS